jgi:hypothetical protein
MAVELRCPDCRAKLRLSEQPEPGTDVECPECNAVFPAPDPDTGETPDTRGKKEKKKKKKAADGAKKKDKPAAPGDKAPKKRKFKKKETNQTAMIAVIAGAVVFLILVVGLLVWFFSRKPPSYEMMNYLPEDATEAVGLNLGHMHKYSEFIKTVEPTYKEQGFQKAIDALCTATGADAKELPDYMLQGWGKNAGALVIRTKKEFDADDLKKLPGAREGKADGETYYSISGIPKLFGGQPLKVFAPTKRLIVFCEYNTPDATFRKMLTGNKDGDTLNKRLGSLGKRTTRGTFWWIGVLDTSNRPKAPKENSDGSGALATMVAGTAAKGRGAGFKASLGSRAIRFEVVLWFEDSEVASELYKKNRESDLTKAQDDSSLDPPKWWNQFGQTWLGSKKATNELFTNLSFKSSGDLFIVSSECETKIMMEGLSTMVSKITGQQAGAVGGMGGGGPPMGGGGPPAGVPGGGPPGGAPGLPGGVAPPGVGP